MTRADSATQVYTGQPSAPPPGHGDSGTLPVTGFEVVVMFFVALALIGFGAIVHKMGGRK